MVWADATGIAANERIAVTTKNRNAAKRRRPFVGCCGLAMVPEPVHSAHGPKFGFSARVRVYLNGTPVYGGSAVWR